MIKTFIQAEQRAIEEKKEQLQRIVNGSLSPRIKYTKYEIIRK